MDWRCWRFVFAAFARLARSEGIVLNTIFELNPMAPFGFRIPRLNRELGPEPLDAFLHAEVVMRY